VHGGELAAAGLLGQPPRQVSEEGLVGEIERRPGRVRALQVAGEDRVEVRERREAVAARGRERGQEEIAIQHETDPFG
jgi:hypothetical protein